MSGLRFRNADYRNASVFQVELVRADVTTSRASAIRSPVHSRSWSAGVRPILMALRAVRFPRLPVPSFVCHVSHVFGLSSEKQVSRIDAFRVIATVEDALSLRNGAVFEFPCDSMSGPGMAELPANAKTSIAPVSGRSCPFPARLSLSDFRPKTFGNRGRFRSSFHPHNIAKSTGFSMRNSHSFRAA